MIAGYKGQAAERVQAERLTPENAVNAYVIVRPRFDKIVRQAEMICPPSNRLSSNRSIDATMSFYGLYVAINQQVTLQNQDPIRNKIQNGVGKSFLMDLEAEA